MANKKKTTTAIVAGVTAVALLLGGTFAWTSISQRALNEAAGIVNVGGRLHDDFNGENKDIYVENFTDPLNGGQPIYARIRLDEYMEVGSEAGMYDAASNSYVAGRNAKPVVDGTDIADVTTWTTHVPTESCTVCATSDSCAIHDHWTWTMGNTEAKYYMPTFNKDKDSLDADVNGTYHGKDDTDKVYYDDYVEYVKDQTVTKDAYYDDDTDTRPNVHEPLAGAIAKQETHTAKLTGTATVITMTEWLQNPVAGNFWVYDDDGWAYWANPIMPGESTGFLLDSIKMEKNPGEKCYYAINVVAQFATVGDWEYFTDKDGNFDIEEDSDALTLLETVSGNVTTVTVTNNGATTLNRGDSTTFTATASKASDVATAAEEEFTWAIYDADLKPVTTSTIENGKLTVGENETNTNLIIAATHVDSGAVGLASVAVKMPEVSYTVSLAEAEAAHQNITISGIKDSDYPLIVKLYELEAEDSSYTDENVKDTVTITSDGNYQQTSTVGMIQDLTVLETGDIVLKSNFTTSIGESSYLVVSVTNSAGNTGASAPLLVKYLDGCFVAGTQVQTVNGPVAIENIQVGDKVYSIDLATGEKVTAAVTWVQEERYTNATYTIRVGGEELIVTKEHPFYVVGKGWIIAGELKAGDKLLTDDGEESVIDEIIYASLDEPVQIYNFTVEGTHNYLVGENGILVHNKKIDDD